MNIDLSNSFHPSDNDKFILKHWKDSGIYNDWIHNTSKPIFHFVDGPPFVSSDNLHYGHILISLLKSSVLYYKRMEGYNVLNKLGYDTHGLPIEMVVNNLLGVNTRREILNMGVDKYNAKCKETISNYANAWKPTFESIGRMTDDDNYKTMDPKFMESVWWVFKQLWDKGLVYRGKQVMPYSTKCNTPLSNFEAGQNYKDVEDTTVYVAFQIIGDLNVEGDEKRPSGLADENNYIIAWTTTPWTLPSNIALCVNPYDHYVMIFSKKLGKKYIVAKNCIEKVFSDFSLDNYNYNYDYQILDCFSGNQLNNVEYKPLFNYETNSNHVFKIVADDFVKCFPFDKDKCPGSGVVHLAPLFGEDDWRICNSTSIIDINNMPYQPIDENGFCNYKNEDDNDVKLNGIFYKDTNKLIIKDLENRGFIIKKEQYRHSYPFCWRTDTPLIYRATDAWFINVKSIQERLIDNNKKINWFPENIGTGRFHKWLENTRDWCISRNRIFGTPLPIWIADDNEIVVIGSIEELKSYTGVELSDLHMEFVDKLEFIKDGKKFVRVTEVFDCWFESGAVPYGQIHYPFENKDYFDNDNEALCDFICEGIDQTRGWFYTLHVLATALFDKPAFKNVICSGLILASDGRKISKRLGNFVPPNEVITKYGADVLRLYMLKLPATYAESSKFKEEDIIAQTKTITQWINSFKFLIEHIKMYELSLNTKYEYVNLPHDNEFDNWIVSRLHTTIKNIKRCMTKYELSSVIDLIYDFIEDYTNWFLKFNRARLKGKLGKKECFESLSICVYITNNFNKALAPITPFLSETIFLNMKQNNINFDYSKSVLLLDYFNDETLLTTNIVSERRFALFQKVCNIIRHIRNTNGLNSLKTPIKIVKVYVDNDISSDDLDKMSEYFLSDVVNILETQIIINKADKYEITMDAKWGKKYKSNFNKIKEELSKLDISQIENKNIINVCDYEIPFEEIIMHKKTSLIAQPNEILYESDGLNILLDKSKDGNVKDKLFIRTLVSHTQKIRKEKGIRQWEQLRFHFMINNLKCNELVKQYVETIKIDLGGFEILMTPDVNNPIVESNFIYSYDDDDDTIVQILIYKN